MPPDPVRVRSYLLGGMSGDELAAFEENFFSDDATFEALENAEWELADAYVEQRLSPDEQRAFQETFLASPQRLRKIAIASGLRKLAGQTFRDRQPAAPQSALRKWLAIAAITAGLLGFVVWSWRDRNLLYRELMNQSKAAAILEKQLKAERDGSAALEQEIGRLKSPANSATSSPPVLSFVLTPGVLRDAQPRSLAISRTAQTAEFVLEVEGTRPYSRFRVALISAGQVEVWSSEVPTSASEAYRPDPIKAPAAVLRPGQFVLTLKGMTSAGRWQPVNEYSFRIVRP